MCRYRPQILQRKDFTTYDRPCYKVICYCNLIIQKARSDLNAIMKYRVAVYGTVDKFVKDSGGEFVNEEFMTLCKALNKKVHTTGVESPWSNGIIERHS